MGGYRSGRRPDKFFATVEDCCKVTLYGVRGKGVSPLGTTHGCRLLRAARLDAQIWWLSKSPRLHLRCTCFEEKDSEPVELATTIPYFKGLRFWLVCPSCRRRVTKLFCIRNRRSFLCRICQGLTYRSCRDSHDLDAIIAKTRQPWQSRAEALCSLRVFRETLWASCGYGLKK